MKLKTFSICTSIILSLLVLSCIVCCFIVIPTPFKFTEKPVNITVYNYKKSSKGETVNSIDMKDEYENLYESFINCSNFSIFERIASGANIFEKVGIDDSQKRPTWSTAKSNNATIELQFETEQYLYVYKNGKSRRIDFNNIAMVIEEKPVIHEVAIYYKKANDANYSSLQIIMNLKTNELYKIINSIIK